jgi:hypothetical protein
MLVKNILPGMLFITAMSALATLLVFLYQNLYFDLSMVFVLSYLLKSVFVNRNIWISLILLFISLVIYGLFAKFNWPDLGRGGEAA